MGLSELGSMFGEWAMEPVGIKTLLSPSWLSVSAVLDSDGQYSKECLEIRNILDIKFPDLYMPQDTLNKALSNMADDGNRLVNSIKVPLENIKRNGKPPKKHELSLTGTFRFSMNQRFILEILDLVKDMRIDAYRGMIKLSLVLTPLNVLVLAILCQNKTWMTPENILARMYKIKSVHTNGLTKSGVGMSKTSMTVALDIMKRKGFVCGGKKKGYGLARGDVDRFLMTIKFFRELEALWSCRMMH